MRQGKDKLTIMLIAGNNAPIPDVLGGGAERLITMLADQNEQDNRAKFIIVSPENEQAREKSFLYRNSEFIYMKKNGFLLKTRNAMALLRCRFTGHYTLRKGYYSNIFKFFDHKRIDIAVDENGYVPELKYISDTIGKEKTIAHIHWNVNPAKQEIDGLYGGIIGVSNFVADSWLQGSKDSNLRRMVVYSAVNENRFHAINAERERNDIRSHYEIGKDDIVFLYCGRLNAQKGIGELIRAFKKLRNANIALLIAGGSYLANSKLSDYEKELKRIASDDKRIHFTGYIDNSQLYKYYMAADAQIIPTLVEEAAGLVAIEGMLMGLPIIATNSGGLPEYLSDKCAIIVDKSTALEQNLVEAMKRIAANKSLRSQMAKAAADHAKNFSQEKYYNDFIDCIEAYYHTL